MEAVSISFHSDHLYVEKNCHNGRYVIPLAEVDMLKKLFEIVCIIKTQFRQSTYVEECWKRCINYTVDSGSYVPSTF